LTKIPSNKMHHTKIVANSVRAINTVWKQSNVCNQAMSKVLQFLWGEGGIKQLRRSASESCHSVGKFSFSSVPCDKEHTAADGCYFSSLSLLAHLLSRNSRQLGKADRHVGNSTWNLREHLSRQLYFC
jgi:hypothetical protein